MITIVLMYAMLAATYGIAKTALKYANPYFIVSFRMAVAGVLLLGFQYIFNRKHFRLQKTDLFLFFQTTLFSAYLIFVPEIWALQRLSSTKVVTICAIFPFVTALLAYFIASERLTIKKIVGMIIGVIGIIPLIITADSSYSQPTELFSLSAAEAVLLIAIFSSAYGWFVVKKLMDRGYHLPMISGVAMMGGGIWGFATTLFATGTLIPPVSSLWPFLICSLALVALGNVIFPNMYGWNLRNYSFTLVSFAAFLSPIFGTFYGWYFLSETISWHHGASLLMIGVGLAIFFRDELRAG